MLEHHTMGTKESRKRGRIYTFFTLKCLFTYASNIWPTYLILSRLIQFLTLNSRLFFMRIAYSFLVDICTSRHCPANVYERILGNQYNTISATALETGGSVSGNGNKSISKLILKCTSCDRTELYVQSR